MTEAPRFIDVLVDEHDELPDGCCLRFKTLGEPRPVARVQYEPDEGPAAIYRVEAPGEPSAQAAVVEDSGGGTAVLVYGGPLGLRLVGEVMGQDGRTFAEPYLLLAAEAVLD